MRSVTKLYDKKALIKGCLGIVLTCVCMKVAGGIGALLIVPILLGALSRNRQEWIFYSLLMITCLTVTNDNIAPKDFVFTMVARVVYLFLSVVMTLQLTAQTVSKILQPVLWLLAYIAYMAGVAWAGWNPIISYLKLILFVLVFFAFYSVANHVSSHPRVNPMTLRSVMLSFVVFFIFGSIALLPFPAIAMLRVDYFVLNGLPIPEGSLFMGMTSHSQALGPMSAMMGILLLADLLFAIRRWDKLYLTLLGCVLLLVFKSGSRTAMGTLVIGCAFTVLLFMRAHGVGARWRGRAVSALMMLAVVVGLLIAITPRMREQMVSFIYKARGEKVEASEQTYERLLSSRQGLIDNAMDNFRESPWIGNGFQVSLRYKDWEPDSWKQLLSAPVEKGVWIPALLEEGGVFGMSLFLMFLIIMFFSLLQWQAYVGLIMLLSMLVCNLGEFTLFSMSSLGGFLWAMVFLGLALDAQRLKEERLRRQMAFQGPVTVSAQGYRF